MMLLAAKGLPLTLAFQLRFDFVAPLSHLQADAPPSNLMYLARWILFLK
jgi:hypothetical protein